MADLPLSLAVSTVALGVSALTAYMTLFRRGTVRMTRPTTIFFGSDGNRDLLTAPTASKVYLRCLLYSTGKRGRIVESMFVALRRGETQQVFNIWVHGEEKDNLKRGSGLYVGESGVALNHHFLLPKDGSAFEFLIGSYVVDVYATVVGSPRRLHLGSIGLTLTEKIRTEMCGLHSGVHFDWGPDSNAYHAHLTSRW